MGVLALIFAAREGAGQLGVVAQIRGGGGPAFLSGVGLWPGQQQRGVHFRGNVRLAGLHPGQAGGSSSRACRFRSWRIQAPWVAEASSAPKQDGKRTFFSLGRVQVISRARHRAVLGPGKAAGGAHEATRRSHSRAAYGSRREEKRCHHHQGAISSEAAHHAFPIWRLGLFGAGWGSRFLGGPPSLVATAEVALLLCVLRIGAGPACRNS